MSPKARIFGAFEEQLVVSPYSSHKTALLPNNCLNITEILSKGRGRLALEVSWRHLIP